MKICATCTTETDEATCPACGEASWLNVTATFVAKRDSGFVASEVTATFDDKPVAATFPKRSKKHRSSK